MEPSYLVSKFTFQKTGVGTSGGTVACGYEQNPSYPYETAKFGVRAMGRAYGGAHYSYSVFEGKRRWTLHWQDATDDTVDILGSFFASNDPFLMKTYHLGLVWFEVRCVTPDYSPMMTYVNRWDFTVELEEV